MTPTFLKQHVNILVLWKRFPSSMLLTLSGKAVYCDRPFSSVCLPCTWWVSGLRWSCSMIQSRSLHRAWHSLGAQEKAGQWMNGRTENARLWAQPGAATGLWQQEAESSAGLPSGVPGPGSVFRISLQHLSVPWLCCLLRGHFFIETSLCQLHSLVWVFHLLGMKYHQRGTF